MNLLLGRFGTVGAFTSSDKGAECWYMYCGVSVGVVRAAVIPLCSGLVWSKIELKSVSSLCSVPMVV